MVNCLLKIEVLMRSVYHEDTHAMRMMVLLLPGQHSMVDSESNGFKQWRYRITSLS